MTMAMAMTMSASQSEPNAQSPQNCTPSETVIENPTAAYDSVDMIKWFHLFEISICQCDFYFVQSCCGRVFSLHSFALHSRSSFTSQVCIEFWVLFFYRSRITVVTMAGSAIAVEDMSATTKILTVKKRVFALNKQLFVRRQRLVYSAGPRGMDALADDETLGGAGVARDGTAKLDVLVADLTAADAEALGQKVWLAVGLANWKAVIIFIMLWFTHS
jgi:hypothetical protein